jgi:hypothetical protein
VKSILGMFGSLILGMVGLVYFVYRVFVGFVVLGYTVLFTQNKEIQK